MPILDHAFFEQTVLKGQFGHNLFQGQCFGSKLLHLGCRGLANCVTRQAAFTRLKELLRPIIIQALCNAFATAQHSDAFLAPQASQDDLDLFPGRAVYGRIQK